MIINHFTKNELLGLLYIVNSFIRYCDGGDKALTMKTKIQYLIDNYCEYNYILCDDMHRLDECSEPSTYNPDCYCGQPGADGNIIKECGYPPHNDNN